ncbi:hypothetical protein D3C80_551450 [compost metagenome]
MAFLGSFDHIGFVDFDTEARPLRNADEAIGVMEDFLVGDIVEDIVALIIVDTEALFLNEGVVGDCIDLQAGGKGDRAERAMGCQRHIIGFRHGGYLAAFGNPASMRKIRLDDVDITVRQNLLEIPA